MGDMTPPEEIADTARWLERLGFSHITIPEDCFYLPALVGVTLALAGTESIPIGTSIVSAMAHHPAILSMEIAGISRAFPGRFRPGIGLGLPEWLDQMGILPDKAVGAMREAVTSVQRLLAGDTVTLDGKRFTLDAIRITHPATARVPITMGVMSPMMLSLAGEIADTTLFGAAAGLDYFRFAISHVESGMRKAGRPLDAMTYSTIALACVDDDGAKARDIARPILASFLAEFGVNSLTDAYGVSDELTSMLERGGEGILLKEMPDQWVDDLMLVGTPDEVVERIDAWLDAGISSIAMFLPHESERDTLRLIAKEVIPRVS